MKKVVLFSRDNELQLQMMDSFGVKTVLDLAEIEDFLSDQAEEGKTEFEVFGEIQCPEYLQKYISRIGSLKISFASSSTLNTYLPLVNHNCTVYFNWCTLESVECAKYKGGMVSLQNCVGTENFYTNSKALELGIPPVERLNRPFLRSLVSLWLKPTADWEISPIEESECTKQTYSDVSECVSATFLNIQHLMLNVESFSLLCYSKSVWISFHKCWLIVDSDIEVKKSKNETTEFLTLDVGGLSFHSLNSVLSMFENLKSLTTVDCDFSASTLFKISKMASLKEIYIKGNSTIKCGKSVCHNVQDLTVMAECKFNLVELKRCFPRARIRVFD